MSAKLEIKNKSPKPASSQVTNTTKGKKKSKSENAIPGETEATPLEKTPVVKVQCHAARADKKRCTRITTKDAKLCYWHVEHLTYGMYVTEPAGKKGKKQGPNTNSGKSVVATKNAKTSDAAVDTPCEQPVTDGQQPSEPPKPKTRGRKRKQAIDPRFNDPAYITMWPEICDGICVLVDRHDNVYTYGSDPVTFLGIKLLTGKIDRNAGPRLGF